MKKVVTTQNAPAAIGPYSQAIEINGMLFASGQIPLDPKTGTLVEGDIKSQARQALTNVKSLVESAGYSLSNVVKTTCFLADMNDFAAFNEVYAEFFEHEAPARSAVAVKSLPKNALCEVEVIAVL